METKKIGNLEIEPTRVAIGTWAIGGWMWGGKDDENAIKGIREALDLGINIIDTAPVYGFGHSEEIVGKAVKGHANREDVIIATKVALNWKNEYPFRDSRKERIFKEIDDSLRRLKTDYIDIYQIHWPDPETPFEETAEAMNNLMEDGKIRAIGVSNYHPEHMDAFRKEAPLHSNQPPYNLFERGIEEDTLPYCKEHDIKILAYGSLCRGLLSGKMTPDYEFHGDDLRKNDPKFKQPRYDQYLHAVRKLDDFARENYGKRVLHLAIRWLLDHSADIALWGVRKPEQIDPVRAVFDWKLDDDALKEIDKILDETIKDPVGPEFMAPPTRSEK